MERILWLDIVQMEKPPLAFLLYPNAGEPFRQG